MSFPYTFPITFTHHGIYPDVDVWDNMKYEADHVGKGLDLLLEQFKDKDGIESILIPVLNQVQDCEGVAWQMLTLPNVDNATGDLLDKLGKNVRQLRNNLENGPYRTMIRARIRTNRSHGRVKDFIDILEIIFGEDLDVSIYQYYPCGVIIQLNNVTTDDANSEIVSEIMQSAKAAGIYLGFASLSEPEEERFLFGDYESSDDMGAGFGDYESSDAGGLVMEVRD